MAEGVANHQDDLTADQTEKLLQFQDLTGLDDMSRCREILQRHNWDMEVAVQDRFNQEEGVGSLYQERRTEERTPAVDTSHAQRVYTVARRQPQGLVHWGYFIVLFPFQFLYSTFMGIFRFALRLLRPDPRRNVTDPLGDVNAFVQMFESQFGPLHPTFFQGTYSQALNEAKRDLRFLLVYLHGDDHQDTAEFCRNTLCNPDVSEFINLRMLFWACNTSSPEGYRVSTALRENTYPFLAVIVLRDNKMALVARLEGPISAEDLMPRLDTIMHENEASLIVARADREERNFNQTLRNEQDEAYLESLKADQEKERIKREARELVEKQVEEEKSKELEEKKRLEDIEKQKDNIRNQLPQEPIGDEPNVIRVVLKLPNGTRLERKFYRNQSMKHLYNFVFVHEAAPDNFEIKTNFPKRTITCQPLEGEVEPQTFEEAGLGKSEMLFVHDNEA